MREILAPTKSETPRVRIGRAPRQTRSMDGSSYHKMKLTIDVATALLGSKVSCRFADGSPGFEFFKILGFTKMDNRVYIKTSPLDSSGSPVEVKYPTKSYLLHDRPFEPRQHDFLIEGRLKSLTRNYSVKQVCEIFKTEDVLKFSVLAEGVYGPLEVIRNDFEQYIHESGGFFRVGSNSQDLVIDHVFDDELMLGGERKQESSPATHTGMSNSIKLELCYRDAGNYKTFFSHTVDLKLFPEAKNLKEGDEIIMGEYGTLSEDNFFESDIHPTAYNSRMDHSYLDIEKVIYVNAP